MGESVTIQTFLDESVNFLDNGAAVSCQQLPLTAVEWWGYWPAKGD